MSDIVISAVPTDSPAVRYLPRIMHMVHMDQK